MNTKFSGPYLITRLLMICSIIFTILLLVLILITSHYLLKIPLSPDMKNIIPHVTFIMIMIVIFLVVAQITLFVLNIVYSSRQYLNLIEKLDFNDVHTSINLLNSIKSVDEIGYLGKNVAKLLDIYINYATIYKKRLAFEQAKTKIILDNLNTAGILVRKSYSSQDMTYIIYAINKKALKVLNLNNSGQAVENSIISFIHTNDQKHYIDTILSFDLSALESNCKPNEVKKENIKVHFIVPSSSTKKEETVLINTTIIPFCIGFYDNYQYKSQEANQDNKNLVLDSYLLLLSEPEKPTHASKKSEA